MDGTDTKSLKTHIGEMKDRYFELERQVNKDAESERNHIEEQMKDLVGKEKTLNENKDQIFTNIDKLDEKSEQSVRECFEFVNKYI